jgi:hypothetical protein
MKISSVMFGEVLECSTGKKRDGQKKPLFFVRKKQSKTSQAHHGQFAP